MTADGDAMTEVRLRAVEDSDLDILFEHQADSVAAQVAAFPSREREQFDAHWAKIRGDDTVILRTILADSVVAGNLGSWADGDRRLISYWIGREHWGRGVATRALTLFLGEVPIRPLHAFVAASNTGSIRVLQKCGFQRDHAQEALEPEPEDGVEDFLFVLSH